MKRTPIPLPQLPEGLTEIFSHGQVYDSSCSREAKVIYTDHDGGYFLKRSAEGTLRHEWEMTTYFHGLGLSVEPIKYLTVGGEDLLLTRAGRGEDATDARYLAEPLRLAEWLGTTLRELHTRPCTGCPVQNRTAEYLATVEEGARIGRFDPAYAPVSTTPALALAEVRAAASSMTSCVLLHGDYCLPNVLLDDWRLSAFIDLGAAGCGDRHIDLFWGAWTLCFNLGTDAYRDRFLDAYGREDIDPAILRVVGFAECFG